MKKILFIIFITFILSVSLVSAFGYNIYDDKVSNTTTSTYNTNRSDYWDNLDTPADITANGMWTRSVTLLTPTNAGDDVNTDDLYVGDEVRFYDGSGAPPADVIYINKTGANRFNIDSPEELFLYAGDWLFSLDHSTGVISWIRGATTLMTLTATALSLNKPIDMNSNAITEVGDLTGTGNLEMGNISGTDTLTISPVSSISTIQTGDANARMDFKADRTTATNTAFRFANADGTQLFQINDNGNAKFFQDVEVIGDVGIGTNSPLAKLDVRGIFRVSAGGNDALSIQPFTDGNSYYSAYGVGGSGEGGHIFRGNSDNTVFLTLEPDKDAIFAGNVEIAGTTNISTRLDVYNSIRTRNFFYGTAGTGNEVTRLTYAGTDSGRLQLSSGGAVKVQINSADDSFFNGGDINMSNDLNVGQDLDVAGNVYGESNWTITLPHASLCAFNESGDAIVMGTQNLFYNFTMDDFDSIGFTRTADGNGLVNVIDGEYNIVYHASGSGDANSVYATRIAVNGVGENCSNAYFRTSNVNDIVTMSGTAQVELDVGDVITMQVADTTGTSTGKRYSSSLTTVRIGHNHL